MSFAREKRLLVGFLAFLAPLPLPLNEVLEWSFLWVYLVAVAVFLRSAALGREKWLSPWAMNFVGLLYLPFLYFDITARWNGQLVRPVAHLAMFAVVIKLFALRRERDKWQTLFGIFFLFLASMATSVHPSIVVYLVLFLAVTLTLLTRFSLFSVLARFGYREWRLKEVPLRGFVVGSTLLSILVGVPLFALLPRIKSPYIVGRGVGSGTVIRASGFSDQVSLDTIGSIRQSHEVALRMAFEEAPNSLDNIRLKASTYEIYNGRNWAQSPVAGNLTPNGPGGFLLENGAVRNWAQLWLQPLRSKSLPMPIQSLQLEIRARVLNVDRGGAISVLFPPDQIVEYRVALTDGVEVSLAGGPDLGREDEPTLDTSGVSPAIRDYAEAVAGTGSDREKARAIEDHLVRSFRYTTDLVGRTVENPIEEFLLRTKEGHCEYFASAMVLMLRSEGIPARLVTGFLGAEENQIEGYYVVRQSNAHAWVEAFLPEQGWTTFEPTPPSGRPGALDASLGLFVSQMWDFVSFRWDRYVLTFGVYDQFEIVSRFRSIWRTLTQWRRKSPGEPETPGGPIEVPEIGIEASSIKENVRQLGPWLVGILWVIGLVAAGYFWQRSRRPLTATRAYTRVRERMGAAGVPVSESLAPLAFSQKVLRDYPELESPVEGLVWLYLRESFGGEEVAASHQEELEGFLREVRQRLAS